ncbi:3-phosphoshikimate 1-carboxyvinyltransferase [Flavobacteriales bacterium 34_180_T64]|nr:3-phosphoshikimate 1-carboxyvinyltransferase [Flavobacteriales bacterium 34_180_T64]
MTLQLKKSNIVSGSEVTITGSKSESNRLLVLQALYPEIQIENISNADDTVLMQKALKSPADSVDIHHAGTAMRFLAAFYAIQDERKVCLTGSQRMKERPIEILVDALRRLGADIEYLENEGYPPLIINGKTLDINKVSIDANVSSQYISALLLIAPQLRNGLELSLIGDMTSLPYINMTLNLLNQLGVETSFNDQLILVKPFKEIINSTTIVVESDWSSASYYYSIVALSPINTEIRLTSYKQNSFQGDSVLAELYQDFGVFTKFKDTSIVLKKTSQNLETKSFHLNKAPDIAQTIVVTCFALGIACHLSGLHTLKIKETDRLIALKTELEKLGGVVSVTNDSLSLEASTIINDEITISTYNDHRMAMAFAPLALKTNLKIENADVVSKSYPRFWDDLNAIGFQLSK